MGHHVDQGCSIFEQHSSVAKACNLPTCHNQVRMTFPTMVASSPSSRYHALIDTSISIQIPEMFTSLPGLMGTDQHDDQQR